MSFRCKRAERRSLFLSFTALIYIGLYIACKEKERKGKESAEILSTIQQLSPIYHTNQTKTDENSQTKKDR